MERLRSTAKFGFLLACGLAVAAIPLRAETIMHVLVSGENCGGTYKGAEGAFDAVNFFFGAINPEDIISSTGGGAASRPSFGSAIVVKAFDRCTPALFKLLVQGRHIQQVVLRWDRTDTPATVMRITLEQCVVKAVNYGTSQESVSFDWVQMTITYMTIDANGKVSGEVSFGWNRATNSAT